MGIHQDTDVLPYACYLIDLSLLSSNFLKFPASLIVICALSMSLQRSIEKGQVPEVGSARNQPADLIARRTESKELLYQMAKTEKVSALDY